MGSGNMSKTKKHQVKRALADLLFNHKDEVKFYGGEPSSVHLSELLLERYKYTVARQTIKKYLNEGLDKYRKTTFTADNDKIKDIREAMRIQKMIWNDNSLSPNDRTKAANSWRGLHKQQMEYEEQLSATKIKMAEVGRPIYQICFNPPSALIKCPKCNHEFYNLDKKEKNDKKFEFKTDKNQRSFDDFGKRKDKEK